ncbi:response regulator [Nakamurella panacisegetis]|uniref:response regulator n=1 Tax=Nakamurella panacisegetis TaxID=1090615 RepID=UPI0012FD0D6A|nr:response regulator [Nakamurella panacisegetis]
MDDDPDQLYLLSTHLQGADCDVVAVSSGELAVASLQDHVFDLAVIDLRLPGIGGNDVAVEVRSSHPLCRVVFTSVLDADTYPPAHGGLPKPFTRQQVLNLLTHLKPGGQA